LYALHDLTQFVRALAKFKLMVSQPQRAPNLCDARSRQICIARLWTQFFWP